MSGLFEKIRPTSLLALFSFSMVIIVGLLLIVVEGFQVSLILSVIGLFMALIAFANSRSSQILTPINGFLAIYLLFSVIAYLLSPDQGLSLRRLTTLLLGATVYLLAQVWVGSSESRRKSLFSALAMGGGIISLLALFTIEWPSRYLMDFEVLTRYLPHIGGDFYLNHNQMAGAMLMLLPFALALFFKTRGGNRWLYAASALGMVAILVLAQSRNAYLAALIAALTALLWGRIRYVYILLAFILLALLPFAAVSLSDSEDLQDMELVSALDMGSKVGPSQDQSWLARLEIWSNAVQMMRHYPAVGGGLYTFAPMSRANYVFSVVRPNLDISHAHNLFLQVGTSLGWAGWLAVIGLWMLAMYGLWRTAGTYPSNEQWMPRSLATALAGYLIFNSFDVLAFEQRAGILVWLVLALASLVIKESQSEYSWLRWLWLAPLALYLAMLVTPLFRINIARLQLDSFRFSKDAQSLADGLDLRLPGDTRRLALVNHFLGDDEKEFDYWRTDPDASLFLIGQGQMAYFDTKDLDQAIDWYSLSISVDRENGRAYFWRGITFEEQGLFDRATSDYKDAIAFGSEDSYGGIPLAAIAWQRLGRLQLETGELEKAIVSFSSAVSLAPEISDFRIQLEDVKALHEMMKKATSNDMESQN
jgi:tetratricopeptide (TPR) repeat protein